jgi:hypothetical protein
MSRGRAIASWPLSSDTNYSTGIFDNRRSERVLMWILEEGTSGSRSGFFFLLFYGGHNGLCMEPLGRLVFVAGDSLPVGYVEHRYFECLPATCSPLCCDEASCILRAGVDPAEQRSDSWTTVTRKLRIFTVPAPHTLPYKWISTIPPPRNPKLEYRI